MAKLKVAEQSMPVAQSAPADPEQASLRRQLATLAKPIRAMGRQAPGPSVRRNDGADVDLQAYIETAIDTPTDVVVRDAPSL